MTLSYDLFPANHGSTFPINSRYFSFALHSMDLSWQASDENFQEMNILIKTILVYCSIITIFKELLRYGTVRNYGTLRLDFWKKYGSKLRTVFLEKYVTLRKFGIIFFGPYRTFVYLPQCLFVPVNDCLLTVAVNVSGTIA